MNLANSDGQTPLLKSIQYKDLPMVKILLAHGADVHVTDVYGRTAISLARESDIGEMIQLITNSRQK